MRVSFNRFALSALQFHTLSSESLARSMNRLSSGERLSRPGDGPAKFGIADHFSYQIRNSTEALRNLENAQNMINSTNEWLQASQEILSRMSELSIAALDASKSLDDRENLNIEYIQLKEEVSRIAQQARYNGIPVASHDQILTYDNDAETFRFSLLDGSQSYQLPNKVLDGLESSNQLDFLYDNTKDFTLSSDGRHLLYVDSNDDLVRYTIHSGELARDTSDTGIDKRLDVDDENRLWYASQQGGAGNPYVLRQQDIVDWNQDTDLVNDTMVTDMADSDFHIYSSRVYYRQDGTDDIVSRSILNPSDVTVEWDSSAQAYNTNEFAISEDGLYLAEVDSVNTNTVRVYNMVTKKSSDIIIDPNAVVTEISFSVDANELVFIDTNTDEVRSVTLEKGARPLLGEAKTLMTSSGATGFSGLSVDGGSHRTNINVHAGADAAQSFNYAIADVRTTTLGISKTSILLVEDAREALGLIQKAIDEVSIQRSRLGAYYSRISHTHSSLNNYRDNMTTSRSRLADTDVAAETTALTQHRIQFEATAALLAQANTLPQRAIALLQRR